MLCFILKVLKYLLFSNFQRPEPLKQDKIMMDIGSTNLTVRCSVEVTILSKYIKDKAGLKYLDKGGEGGRIWSICDWLTI